MANQGLYSCWGLFHIPYLAWLTNLPFGIPMLDAYPSCGGNACIHMGPYRQTSIVQSRSRYPET